MELSDNNAPKVGLRMNSIEIDYESIATSPVSGRSIRLKPCAVRVDIYTSLLFELCYSFSINLIFRSYKKNPKSYL